MRLKKDKSRIDRFLCEKLSLDGVVKSDPTPVYIDEGDSYSLVEHHTGYNYYCDICGKKLYALNPMYVIILKRETGKICYEPICVLGGARFHCKNRNHERRGNPRKDLAGIVCSEDCFNMYILRKEVA